MTTLLSIDGIAAALEGTDLRTLKTLHKPIEVISDLEMTVLAKQFEMKLGRQRGRSLLRRILAELEKAALLGRIPRCSAARFTPPSPRLTLGEFRRLLLKFNHDERRLIVVALASGKGLTECSLLQHGEIKKMANINNWSAELRRFIEMVPRHISCPYVFWDSADPSNPVPLVGFEVKFREITKASWSTFAQLCTDLIPVDTESDAKEFATMFLLESANPVKA